MRLREIEHAVKGVLVKAEVAVNRRLGREFIPLDLGAFNIETSSACNLKCRFCAYEKKITPRVNMSNEMFADCVEQALALGFDRFHLTPCTGDVFMDKHVLEKLAFLDAHPEVKGYHFFTNLTIPKEEQLAQLAGLRKFERMTVSVYGHDEASFVAIAQSSPKIYARMLRNLEFLLERLPSLPFKVSIGFRSSFDVPANGDTDLMRLLARFRTAGVRVHPSHGIYNNWGGYISQQDVAGLNMRVLDGDAVHHSGACVKLFDAVQVLANGVVNACSCRDVDATLKIGDLNECSLGEILSADNPLYRQIIDEQQRGDFRPVCRGCDYYRSIYHQPKNYRREGIPTQTFAQYLQRTERAGVPGGSHPEQRRVREFPVAVKVHHE